MLKATSEMKLGEYDMDECFDYAKTIIGIRIDDIALGFHFIASDLYGRTEQGDTTLDEAVTILNNLPRGLEIAMLQRNEAIRGDEELEGEVTQADDPADPTLDQLEQDYVELRLAGGVMKASADYVFALEDLVSKMQGKSFTDSSTISELKTTNGDLSLEIMTKDKALASMSDWIRDDVKKRPVDYPIRRVGPEQLSRSYGNFSAAGVQTPIKGVDLKAEYVDSAKRSMEEFGLQVSEQYDAIYKTLLDEYIPEWETLTGLQLRDRINVVRYVSGKVQHVIIDGVKVGEIHEPEFTIERDYRIEDPCYMRALIKFERYQVQTSKPNPHNLAELNERS